MFKSHITFFSDITSYSFRTINYSINIKQTKKRLTINEFNRTFEGKDTTEQFISVRIIRIHGLDTDLFGPRKIIYYTTYDIKPIRCVLKEAIFKFRLEEL